VRNPQTIVRSAAASAVVVFLIAGAAFAGNTLRSSGGDSPRDQVEATATDEATETPEATETAEPTEASTP